MLGGNNNNNNSSLERDGDEESGYFSPSSSSSNAASPFVHEKEGEEVELNSLVDNLVDSEVEREQERGRVHSTAIQKAMDVVDEEDSEDSEERIIVPVGNKRKRSHGASKDERTLSSLTIEKIAGVASDDASENLITSVSDSREKQEAGAEKEESFDGVEFIEGKENPAKGLKKDTADKKPQKKKKNKKMKTQQGSITASLVSASKEDMFAKDKEARQLLKQKQTPASTSSSVEDVKKKKDGEMFDYLIFVPSSKFSVVNTYATDPEDVKLVKDKRLQVKCFNAIPVGDPHGMVRVATLNTLTSSKKPKTKDEKYQIATSRFDRTCKLIPAKSVVFVDCDPDHPESKPGGMINVKTVASLETLRTVIPLIEQVDREKTLVRRFVYLDGVRIRDAKKKKKKKKKKMRARSQSVSFEEDIVSTKFTAKERLELRTAEAVCSGDVEEDEEEDNSAQDVDDSKLVEKDGVIRVGESDENYASLERAEAELEKKRKLRRSKRKRRVSQHIYRLIDGGNEEDESVYEESTGQSVLADSSIVLEDEDTSRVVHKEIDVKRKKRKKRETRVSHSLSADPMDLEEKASDNIGVPFDFTYHALEACRDMLCKGCGGHPRSVGQLPCNHLLYCVMCYAKRVKQSLKCSECSARIKKTVVFHV